MNFSTLIFTTIAAILCLVESKPFSAISVNRINAYRQMLPPEFDVETIAALKPESESLFNNNQRLFTSFQFPNPYALTQDSGPGSGGTKRANLLRLANQAARGFGK